MGPVQRQECTSCALESIVLADQNWTSRLVLSTASEYYATIDIPRKLMLMLFLTGRQAERYLRQGILHPRYAGFQRDSFTQG